MSVTSAIVGQFRCPRGPLGAIAGWIMANRPSNRERNRWGVTLLGLEPTDRVLEIGCGPGLALQLIAARVADGLTIGLDHSPQMAAWARKRNEELIRSGRLEIRCGGLDHLQNTVEPFDKVFSANVVQFFDEPVDDLRLIRSMMRPGGLIVSVHQPRHRGATARDAQVFADRLVEHKRLAGFTALRVERLSLEPVEAVAVLGESGPPRRAE